MYIYLKKTILFSNKKHMTKIILVLLLSILMANTSLARDIYEKELPSKFRVECFEFSSSYNFLKKDQARYKIELNKSDTIAVKDWHLIPIIPYKILGNSYDYTIDSFTNISYITDNNKATFIELDTEKSTAILLWFKEVVKRNTFWLKFKHSAVWYIPELYISVDWKKFSPVSFSSIYDFDIRFLKIKFVKKYNTAKREKIKIYQLSFNKEENLNLIKVAWGWQVDFYSNYKCDDYINLSTLHVPFEIDINTPTVKVELKKNPRYNPNVDTDFDADNIQDYEDNCVEVFNPLQKDSDGDGKWDKCSDIDNDWIVWSEDNCPTISNADQKDINLNNIGDVCEFDKDMDWIFDWIDNCITTPNAHQKDSDHDGIWDMCDNCKYFNPSQKDEDKNNIWDVCDTKAKELSENDDDIDNIINGKDNCPKVANPDQKDSDKDGIWDVCDNCKTIQNTNQYDFNKNNIWDICEDSDWDWIEWIKDNCMNVVNPDQKDSDNDWIWDACEDDDNDKIWFANDNCPTVYNPFQKDIDEDGIGDKCDEKDNRVLESNKTLFIGLLILVAVIFGAGIYLMIQKMKTMNWWFVKKEVKVTPKPKSTKKTKSIKKKLVKSWDNLVESYTDRKRRESEK